jgi:ribosomal silencing factor RsfS
MDNISLVETDQIEEKIQIIMRQTDYSQEQAREKLGKFNFNEMSVIRDYFGITEKEKNKEVKSLNQAIYKEIRGHLDGAMRGYRERVDKGEVKKIV